ncbi:hypothetical protein FSOLCH5_007848 [Fusarium solani]|jgi:hypothetical protein|uniref:Uncharacterized protein n=1 Tax=Fusarium solani TaxID=169388 RepID=A0A9P9KUP7_FUSSL|nr:uncharacterized protein B0J15DRAFT_233090 [Fusarium solani]KAH7268826.1 hypothetical protein B0J15DRAFT_233090 [Fusarium solani]KAJ3460089.1 hypothetical protein MRS44_010956 [Fusarium solani]KAJ4210881.1 hypothetical protein NW759_012912 [Fusarium solani]
MRLTRSRKCRIDTSLAKTSQEATTSDPSDSTDASSPVIVVLPKSQEESPTHGPADSALAKQPIVNGNPKLRRRARGSGGTKSDKDSSSLSRDPLSKRPRSIPAKRRVPGLLQRIKDRADIEISRAEDAQERADLQIKWKRTTPTPTPSIGGEAHDKMAQDTQTWPDQVALQIRPREDAAYNGEVVYQRKSHGPLLGRLASQGSVITIDGEDYVEYRVLAKLRAV